MTQKTESTWANPPTLQSRWWDLHSQIERKLKKIMKPDLKNKTQYKMIKLQKKKNQCKKINLKKRIMLT